jgi:eukaryotic-like serine/threonine-protein kinase
MEEAILAAEARRPSQVIASEAQAQARSTTARRLKSMLKGDLDLIALKTLQKQPEHRYLTVDALRADIERHLTGQAVLAQPESARYRVKKFVLRHKFAVLPTVAVFIALAAGLSAALWQARIARNEARTSAAVEEFTEDIFRTNSLEHPDPVKARQTTARELLDIGARKVTDSLKDAPAAKARMLAILASLYVDLGLDDQAVALPKTARGRGKGAVRCP